MNYLSGNSKQQSTLGASDDFLSYVQNRYLGDYEKRKKEQEEYWRKEQERQQRLVEQQRQIKLTQNQRYFPSGQQSTPQGYQPPVKTNTTQSFLVGGQSVKSPYQSKTVQENAKKPKMISEPGLLGQMSDAFLQGANNAYKNFFTTVSVASEKIAPDSRFAQVMRNSEKGYQKILNEHPEWNAPEDTKWNSPIGIARAVTGTLPFMLMSTIGEIAANIIIPGAGAASVAAVTYSTEYGSAYNEAIALGASEAKANRAAKTAGTINAVIEALPIEMFTLGLWEIPEQFIKKKIRNEVVKYATTVTGKVLSTTLSEGTEEALQQLSNNLSAKTFYDENRQWSEGLTESFVLGSIAGGIISGGVTSVQQLTAKKQEFINQAKEAGISEEKSTTYFDEMIKEATSDEQVDELVAGRDAEANDISNIDDDNAIEALSNQEIKELEQTSPQGIKQWVATQGAKLLANTKQNSNLSSEDQQIQQEAIKRFIESGDGLVALYNQTYPNRIISVDNFAELYDPSKKHRAAVNSVSQISAILAYQNALANPDPNLEKLVVLTAGGPASGKTSTALKYQADKNINPQVTFDSNLAGNKNATLLVTMARAQGYDVEFVYVYQDLQKALELNESRSKTEIRKVDEDTLLKNHETSPQVIEKLYGKYKNNDHYNFIFLDNSGKIGSPIEINSLEELKKLVYNSKQNYVHTRRTKTTSTSSTQSLQRGSDSRRSQTRENAQTNGREKSSRTKSPSTTKQPPKSQPKPAKSVDKAKSKTPAPSKTNTKKITKQEANANYTPDPDSVTTYDKQLDEEATKYAILLESGKNENIDLAEINLNKIYDEYTASGDYSVGGYQIKNSKEIERIKKLQKTMSPIWRTPELLMLARELGTDVEARKVFAKFQGAFYSSKATEGKAAITIQKEIIKDPKLTSYVLAHEIGHFVDWLPSGFIKRSTILRKALVIKERMKIPVIRGMDNKTLKEEVKKIVRLRRGDIPDGSKYARYAFSAKELYAEWFSTLLTQPELVQEYSPKMYQLWMNNIGKKPEVEATYLSMVEAMITGNYLQMRSDSIKNDALMAEEKRQAVVAMAKEQNRNVLTGLGVALLRKDWAVRRDYKRAKRANKGVLIDNPIYALEELGYKEAIVNNYKNKYIKPFSEYINKNNLDINTLHEIAFLQRVINERGATDNPAQLALEKMGDEAWLPYESILGSEVFELSATEQYKLFKQRLNNKMYEVLMSNLPAKGGGIANPYGYDIQTAKDSLAYVKSQNSADWDKYQNLLDDLQTFSKKVLEVAEESGIYTEKTLKMMKENQNYVTFQVIDYVGIKMTAAVKSQGGTFKGIANTIYSTIEKNLAILQAAETNKIKNEIVNWYKQYGENEISEIKGHRVAGGRLIFDEPANQNKYGLIKVYEKGVLHAYQVDRLVADVFDHTPTASTLVRIANFLNKVPRSLFITFNVGFQIANIARDASRYYRNNPFTSSFNPLKAVIQAKNYLRAIPKAIKLVQEKTDASIEEIREARILTERALTHVTEDLEKISDNRKKMNKAFAARFGIENSQDAGLTLRAVNSFMEATTSIGEMIPKIAGYLEYKDYKARVQQSGKPANFSDREAFSIIRNRLGSPNFQNTAKFSRELGSILLFQNAIKEGVISDITAITDPKTRLNTIVNTAVLLLPSLMIIAAAKGNFGEEEEELMAAIPEYDKRNYNVLPLGKTANGEVKYIRLPLSDTERVLKAIIWEIATQKHDDAGDFVKTAQVAIEALLSFFPTMSPWIDVNTETVAYVTGQNIWDSFYQSEVFTEKEMAAGGLAKAEKFIWREMQNLGINVFLPKKDDGVEKTPLQAVVEAPILNNVMGRFLRYSNAGYQEEIQKLSEEQEKAKKIQSVKEDEAIESVLPQLKNGELNLAAALRKVAIQSLSLNEDYYPSSLDKEIKDKISNLETKLLKASVDSKYSRSLRQIAFAPDQATRVQMLQTMREQMSDEDFNALLKEGERTTLIPKETLKEIKKTF